MDTMNSAMAALISRLQRNEAIVITDNRHLGGSIQISTIQLALENQQEIPQESPVRNSPVLQLKNPIERSILRTSKKLKSSTKKKVLFSKSPQIASIDDIDERMKVPREELKWTTYQRKFKTPIRMKPWKPKPLSFTDSNDKRKMRKFEINDNVNVVRGEWNASKIPTTSRIPIMKKVPVRSPAKKSPKKVAKQENLLKSKGVKLNRRFELMMANLVKKKSEDGGVKRKTI